MVRKGEGGRGWGTVFLFAQNSLFRIVTYQMLIVFAIYSWGAAAPPRPLGSECHVYLPLFFGYLGV